MFAGVFSWVLVVVFCVLGASSKICRALEDFFMFSETHRLLTTVPSEFLLCSVSLLIIIIYSLSPEAETRAQHINMSKWAVL